MHGKKLSEIFAYWKMFLLCFTIRIMFQLFNIIARIQGLVAGRYAIYIVSEYINWSHCVQIVTHGVVTSSCFVNIFVATKLSVLYASNF